MLSILSPLLSQRLIYRRDARRAQRLTFAVWWKCILDLTDEGRIALFDTIIRRNAKRQTSVGTNIPFLRPHLSRHLRSWPPYRLRQSHRVGARSYSPMKARVREYVCREGFLWWGGTLPRSTSGNVSGSYAFKIQDQQDWAGTSTGSGIGIINFLQDDQQRTRFLRENDHARV